MGSKRRRGNAYELRHKGRYTTWQIPTGMSKSKAEKQAEKELSNFEELVDRGVNVRKITFAELSEKYLADIGTEKKLSTVESQRSRLKKINVSIGDIEIKTLTKQHIRNFIEELEKGYDTPKGKHKEYSAATIGDYYKTISCVLTYACEQDYLERNICTEKGIKRPSLASGKVKTIPPHVLNDYIEMLKTMDSKYELFFHLLLCTGSRRGEILALKWQDIDYDNCSISINENCQYVSHKGICFDTPKTAASKRVISVPEYIIDMLKEWRVEQAQRKFNCGVLWGSDLKDMSMRFCDNHSKCGRNTTGYCNKNCSMYSYADRIFTTDGGSPMHPDTILDMIQRNAKRHGLEPITLHMLRHTFASICIADNETVTDLSAFLGHSNPRTTMGIYAHAIAERNKAKQVSTNVMEFMKGRIT